MVVLWVYNFQLILLILVYVLLISLELIDSSSVELFHLRFCLEVVLSQTIHGYNIY